MMSVLKVDPQLEFLRKKLRSVAKWIWLVQLSIGLPSLVAGYFLGRTPAFLLLNGTRTVGEVVDVKKISFSRGRNRSTLEYVPIINFEYNGKMFQFQSTIITSSKSTGYQTPILIDQNNPEVAIQDHKYLNWFPWSFFAIIGFILTTAGLNGFRKRNQFN